MQKVGRQLPTQQSFVGGVFERKGQNVNGVKNSLEAVLEILVTNVPVEEQQFSALWAGSVPFWERRASGTRRESEPTGGRVVVLSLFRVKSRETAFAAPEGAGGLGLFLSRTEVRCTSLITLFVYCKMCQYLPASVHLVLITSRFHVRDLNRVIGWSQNFLRPCKVYILRDMQGVRTSRHKSKYLDHGCFRGATFAAHNFVGSISHARMSGLPCVIHTMLFMT